MRQLATQVAKGCALRRAPGERRPRKGRVDVELVHPVPELVHRRKERREIAFAGVCRQADVPEAGLRRERVRRLVEPPGIGVVAERLQYQLSRRTLPFDGKRARDVLDRILAMALDEL